MRTRTRATSSAFAAWLLAVPPAAANAPAARASQDATASESAGPAPRLELGATVTGEVTSASPLVRTPALDGQRAEAPARGVGFELALPAGTATIELRAYLFDAYLVVRDAGGRVVAEDDDGLIRSHARAVVSLEAAATLRVEACALAGGTGPFELLATAGAPPPLDAAARDALEERECRRQIAAIERARGMQHASLFVPLSVVGYVAWKRGDYASALEQHERARAIAIAAWGEADASTRTASFNVAAQLSRLGREEEARLLLEGAHASCLATGAAADRQLDMIERELGDLALRRGRPEEAQRHYAALLELRERRLGPIHEGVVDAATWLAQAQRRSGHPDAAVALLQRIDAALAGDERSSVVDRGWLADHLAQALVACGRLDEALVTRVRSLALPGLDAPGTRDLRRFLELNHAQQLFAMGRFDDAAPVFERILAEFEAETAGGSPRPAELLKQLLNLAAVRSELGQLAAAAALLERATALARELGEREATLLVQALQATGVLRQRMDDLTGARASFEEAAAIAGRVLGESSEAALDTSRNLAFVLSHLGETDAARELARRTLPSLERLHGRASNRVLQLLRTTAANELRAGRPDAARRSADDALERSTCVALLRSRSAAAEDLLRIATGHADAVATSLEVALAEDGLASLAARWSDVLAHKSLVRRELAGRRAARTPGEEPALRERIARLEQLRSELSAAFSPGAGSAADAQRLARLRDERSLLEAELAAALADRPEARAATPDSVARALPEGTVLLDFHDAFVGFTRPAGLVQRTFVWIARGGGAPVVALDLGPSRLLVTAIEHALDAVVTHRGAAPVTRGEPADDPARRAMAELRTRLWDPIAPHVAGARRLAICPDGAVALLPFGIVAAADGSHLLERFEIVHVDDVSRLAARADRDAADAAAGGPAAPSLLVAGAIDYDLTGEPDEGGRAPRDGTGVAAALRGSFAREWLPLSETRREADGIARAHRLRFRAAPRTVLLEEQAAEERLARELERHSVIHLATHGYFLADGLRSLREVLDDEPQASAPQPAAGRLDRVLEASFPAALCGLVCAGANVVATGAATGRANGLLTGEEIAGLDLARCNLAVLSACESGLGRTAASGQGAMSLAAAFRDAGAKTVIASLWQVRDDSTRELMLDFYDRLWNRGESRLDALRNAQLALLRRNREKYGDTRPATWGAFVLTGDVE